jgi:hypothetical protein
MSSSASTYISTPVNVPMADAWGYLNLNTATSPLITDHANVSAVSRLGTGRYGITFAASNRFASNAYVVITTPEYNDDTTYGPVSCRIGNISGSTALGRSAGFEINTFAYNQGFHIGGGGTANVRDPSVLKVGFAAFSFSGLSSAYVPSNTPENKFPFSNDIFEFYKNTPLGGNCTLSRDSIQSPVGNTPLKMVITGNGFDPQTPKGSGIGSVISPASNGQTWRLNVFVRSSAPTTQNAQLFLFGANANGNTNVGGFLSIQASNFLITTEWKKVSVVLTINNPTVEYITFRLDGPDNDSAGTTIWWDGLEIYQENSDYQTVPGAGGYGVTGATYNSHLANMVSKRSATAYGTIVIPQAQGSNTPISAYIENSYNVLGVSAGGNAIFDITFNKPMNNTNYCVILSGEYEHLLPSLVTSIPQEFSDLLVRAGSSNQFKTVNTFRVESRKQRDFINLADNAWVPRGAAFRFGRTERIHFMVFGGGTYGQP